MKTIWTAALLTFLVLSSSQAKAQLPTLGQLSNSIDQAAAQVGDKTDTILGFQKLKMPKLLDGLVDVRLKKPTIPGLGLLDKIKNFGNPNAATTPQTSPLASLGKLFQPPQSSGQGLLSKLFGAKEPQAPSLGSLFNNGSVPNLGAAQQLLNNGSAANLGGVAQQFLNNNASAQNLGGAAQQLQQQAGQLFSGQILNNANNALQPPLQTARQYSEQLR